ncbi:MAG TPA: tetratricopeptide repeat protein, partial [Kofleriaceae bacterium]|nr:tetratricopeptide repeat protein [Kofleriaceae bacterium]
MNPRKAVKELEKQLRKDPHNLVLRVRLAGALVQTGNMVEAIEMYRSVAVAYYAQNRIDQAIAVCHSVLEIAPDHHPSRMLLNELDQRKAAVAVSPSTDESERVDVTPSNTRGRRARRPSGFDSTGFTPASEPDLQKSARFRFDSGRHEPLVGRPPGADPAADTVQGKRFPLSTTRGTMQGHAVIPGGLPDRRKRPSDPRPPGMVERRAARPSEPTQAERTPSVPDPDEEAPTRIADRWMSPRAKPASSGPPGRTPPRPPRPSQPAPPAGGEPATSPYQPPGSPKKAERSATGEPTGTRRPRPGKPSRPLGTPPRDSIDESITVPRTLVPPPTGPGPGSTPPPMLRRRTPRNA